MSHGWVPLRVFLAVNPLLFHSLEEMLPRYILYSLSFCCLLLGAHLTSFPTSIHICSQAPVALRPTNFRLRWWALSIFKDVAPTLGALLEPVDPIRHSHGPSSPGSWKHCVIFSTPIDHPNYLANLSRGRED